MATLLFWPSTRPFDAADRLDEIESVYLRVVRDEGDDRNSVTADFDLREASYGEVLAAGRGVCTRLDAGDDPTEVLTSYYTEDIVSGHNGTIGRIFGGGVSAVCPEYLQAVADEVGNDPDTIGLAAVRVEEMLGR